MKGLFSLRRQGLYLLNVSVLNMTICSFLSPGVRANYNALTTLRGRDAAYIIGDNSVTMEWVIKPKPKHFWFRFFRGVEKASGTHFYTVHGTGPNRTVDTPSDGLGKRVSRQISFERDRIVIKLSLAYPGLFDRGFYTCEAETEYTTGSIVQHLELKVLPLVTVATYISSNGRPTQEPHEIPGPTSSSGGYVNKGSLLSMMITYIIIVFAVFAIY